MTVRNPYGAGQTVGKDIIEMVDSVPATQLAGCALRIRWAARHSCARLRAELAASQAREARLLEALTPFADIATALDADVPQMRRAASVPVDVALLRRARAALAAGGEEGSKPEYDPSVDFDGRDDEYVFPEDGEGARARLREALTELERAASSILEHARFNRADTAPGAQHNSRIARANRAVREARAALAADKDEDHGTTD